MATKTARRTRPAAKPGRPDRQTTPRVTTRLGRLPRVGTNEWGKPLVKCPQCGSAATVDRTGDVWCKECGFTTAQLSGCG